MSNDSDIVKYDRAPGQFGGVVEIPPEHGGGFGVVFGPTSIGDPVFPPEGLAAFGIDTSMRRIMAITREKCRYPGCDKIVPHYAMSGDDGLVCVECVEHRFQWCQRRRPV